jgi:Kdo2-lipid IVA lauroyltransferase/acyltransferase
MEAIGFYLTYAFIWIITLLPMRLLYVFSDFLFLFIYHFPSYRRNVVFTNLKNSFVNKSEEELRSIEKKFYKHFTDLFIETFKPLHMSNAQIIKRYSITNAEILDRLYHEGRDIVAVLGHYNNWEWLICLPFFTKQQIVPLYKPLQNKYFDKFIKKLRSRNGVKPIPMSNVIREIINNRNGKVISMYAFIADQTPPKGEIRYWTTFLNQDTPVFLGPEKIAVKYDMAVVFLNIQKIKRGYYDLKVELLFEHTKELPEHFVTDAHVKRLEELILDKPENWLWSHRRWKHNRKLPNE